MEYLTISFIAGVLTALAPCVFPLLPVILGGSVGERTLGRSVVIITSLVVSVILFTLLLKVSFINVSQEILQIISSGIIFFFGVVLIFPNIWEFIASRLNLQKASHSLLSKSSSYSGLWGWILLGVSLGPVFSACSPTYFFIIGTVLPQNFFFGLINLLSFGAGLFAILLLIAFLGSKLTRRMAWASRSDGAFKKILGIIFVLLGLAIFFGYDKTFEAWLLDFSFFEWSTSLEDLFLVD